MDRRHHHRPIGTPGIPSIKSLPGVAHGFGNPTSGPASSPWSNGNSTPTQPAGPAPTPCTELADLFSECFVLCDGVINPGNLATVCGWSYNDQAAPAGSISFSPGSMTPYAPDVTSSPYVKKAISTLIPSIFGITAQWIFMESSEPGGTPTYIFLVTNDGNTEQLYVQIENTGDLVLEVGPVLAQNTFLSPWVVKPGILRKLSVVVDDVGVPRVFVDDLEIPVAGFGPTSARAGFQGNSAFVQLQNPSGPPITFKLEKIFVASGAKPMTNFCCS